MRKTSTLFYSEPFDCRNLFSDLVRPAYPGSPSIPRESHHCFPTFHYRHPLLSNLIAQRMCALDSRYSRLFHHLATGGGLLDTSRATEAPGDSNSSTPSRGGGGGGRKSSPISEREEHEFIRRVVTYLVSADCLLPLPIGECLVAGVRNNLGGIGLLNSAATNASQLPLAFNPPLPMGTASIGKLFYCFLYVILFFRLNLEVPNKDIHCDQ